MLIYILYANFFSELLTRKHLDRYLSSAFNLRLQEDNTLKVIDECKYVLTLDYTLKVCISAANEATTVYQVSVVWTAVHLHYSFCNTSGYHMQHIFHVCLMYTS